MKRILAISDIHGCYDEFNKLLGVVNYDSSKDQLVLLGDYVDRGKDNLKTIQFVKELVSYGAVALRGNHDQMFIDFVKHPNSYVHVANYIRNGGTDTLRNMVHNFDNYQWHNDSYKQWAEEILLNYPDEFSFMEDELLYYHETDDHIFVHAGINSFLDDWKNTSKDEMIWIREQFLDNPHNLDKTVVHGHTPNISLRNSADIYFGDKKINIDGACAYGHQLNCLEIADKECKTYSVKKTSIKRK